MQLSSKETDATKAIIAKKDTEIARRKIARYNVYMLL